jgi:CHAT domain-containing protein
VLHNPGPRDRRARRRKRRRGPAARSRAAGPAGPSASHLAPYDYQTRPLTVARIIQCETTAAELAFLSASSTAQTSPSLVDEALHITSAFQVAGFPQVVGTLWPVIDAAAAAIVGDFYARYLPGP